MRRNPERGGVITGIVLAAVGILLLIVPGALGLDGFDGGFALGAFGLLLLITGGITVALFAPRARRLNRLFAAENLLAHWVYEPAAVQGQAARDRVAERQRNRVLLGIVAAWLVFWTALFVIYGQLTGEGDAMPLFVGIMAGVGLIVGLAAYLAPRAHARRALRSSGECLIGREGLFINGAYHTWVGRMNRLDSVELAEADGISRLVFHLSALSGPGFLHWSPYVVEAPVPAGRLEEARKVLEKLRG